MPPPRPRERKASLTPEEREQRRIHARRRFKAIVWLVMYHRSWLTEDDDDVKLTDNVRKNVRLITRKKEKKSLITLREKAILCKRAELRTDSEKAHLHRVIGGLKCFRKYPEEVKRQLAAVTYFKFFKAGLVIIRQGDPPYGLYFILSGEVSVTQTARDPILNEDAEVFLGTMATGSMFGEVSLLHGIYRTATITSTTPCEFLVLAKNDFDTVLKESVAENWEQIQKAMERFSYFEGWDEIARRECSILARLASFQPDQTILGDGIGHHNLAYFILKGKCQVIEHLLVNVIKGKLGKKTYKLYNGDEEEVDEQISTTSSFVHDNSSHSKNSTAKKGTKPKTVTDQKSEETLYKPKMVSSTEIISREGFIKARKLPLNVEVHFMQCCFLNDLAVFGLGENFKNRRVVAVTPVECLLIPRYWLYQRDKDYVWSKVRQYLNNHIPSTQDLFRYFLQEKRWQKHKKRLVESIVSRKNLVNFNSIHDVPYSIRITEDVDFP